MPRAIKTHRPTPILPAAHATLKERQGTRTLALNGKAWRSLRRLVLMQQPLCRHCLRDGRTVLAREVDHVDNDPSNNDPANLVGLCTPCHSRKTRRWMNGDEGDVYGCDANGTPLDPAHPWNAEKSPATEAREPRARSHARGRTIGEDDAR